MSLFESHYDAPDGVRYTIVCEEPASGLEGIDGDAWRFRVSDDAGNEHLVVRGIAEPVLEQWGGGHDLPYLLTAGIKLDLKENPAADLPDRLPKRVLTTDTAEPTYDAETAKVGAALGD